jgi:hypothetical protein
MANPKKSSEGEYYLDDFEEDNMNSMPLLDPRGRAGTGWLSPDPDFTLRNPATNDEHSLLPYLPPEVQQIIGENLDQVTLAAAL